VIYIYLETVLGAMAMEQNSQQDDQNQVQVSTG
jgi:hypothetical protein